MTAALRSLRDWMRLLRTETIDLVCRAWIALTDPGYSDPTDLTGAIPPPPLLAPDARTLTRPAGHPNGRPATRSGLPIGEVATRCPICGDITVPSLQVAGVFFQNVPDLSWYGFTCPTCRHRCIRRATDNVREALTKVRTAIVVDHVPAEALKEHPITAMSADDVLDATLWLATHDDLAAAAADARQPREIDLTTTDGDR